MKRLLSILFFLTALMVHGQNYPPAPKPPRLVNDLTRTLSASEVDDLEAKLVAFDNRSSNQIAVVIISSTEGTDPTDYATELSRQWGIGNKENNGVLLFIAKDDHKLSIVPGYGLEGALPDATCNAIINNEIVPYFKQGNYYQGISSGTDAIIKATEGTYKAPQGYDKRGRKGKGTNWVTIVFIIIFIIVMLAGGGGRGGGGMMSRRGYHGINPMWFFPIGGGSGGGGSSGGGGGFGGFGGGSFGGGGSSGSW